VAKAAGNGYSPFLTPPRRSSTLPVLSMQIPQEIPYNPNRRVIVLLLVVAALAFGSGLLSVFPMRLSLSVSTLLVSMAALLVRYTGCNENFVLVCGKESGMPGVL